MKGLAVLSLLLLWSTSCISAVRNRTGAPAVRIFFGDTALEAQFPYQAFIYINNEFVCGASIIHKRWVLTAAHCESEISSADIDVRVGTINVNGIDGQTISAEKFIGHEEYDLDKSEFVQSIEFRGIANDIALIRLSEDIEFNDKVQPIELAKDDTNRSENVTAVVSGLGETEKTPDPDELQYLRVKVISNEKCKEDWARGKFFIFDSCICTTVINKKSVCNGDSRGPLAFENKQLGIVSAGHRDCAESVPNVYTRVSSFISWINHQLESYSDTLP